MLTTRKSRLYTLFCLILFGSGWVRIPIPNAWLPEQIELRGQNLHMQVGTLTIMWAKGQVEATDLTLHLQDQEIVDAPYARLNIGLLPYDQHFLSAHDLRLIGPRIHINPELLATLPESQADSQFELPEMAFLVQGGELTWSRPDAQVLSWRIDTLRGFLGRQSSEVQLTGRMLTPIQSHVRAKLSAGLHLSSWRFQIEGENLHETDSWNPQDIEALRGIEIIPGQYSFRLSAEQKVDADLRTSLQLNLQNAHLSLVEPPLEISQLTLHASGGLREGVQAEFSGVVEDDFDFLAQGRFQKPEAGAPWIYVRGETTAVRVDQDRFDWVRLLHPATADILEGLEIRGGPAARFALDWQQGKPVDWGVHADTAGVTMRYRGIVTREGDKPAFPYPVRASRGDFIAVDKYLLMNVEGKAGSGDVHGHGAVELRPNNASIHIDIDAKKVRIDSEVRAAATGSPELAALWTQSGYPKGGDADVSIRLRTDNARENVGIEIFGTVRNTRIMPIELPIPALVKQLNFHWTPGRARFQGKLTASDTEIEIDGRIIDAADSEFPTIQARLLAENVAPNWATRRTLTTRLELPIWLPLGAPSGPSSFELLYNQPGTSEAPQFILNLHSLKGDLAWGTQLGNRWLPMLSVNRVQADFSVASAGDIYRAMLPRGTMDFGGREIACSFSDGSLTDRDGLLLVSKNLHTPVPITSALMTLFKLDRMTGPLQLECWSDILIEWRGLAEQPLFARLKLDPLTISLPDSPIPMDLRGEFTVSQGRIEAPEFRLEQGLGSWELHDLDFHFGPDVQRLEAVLDSERGIDLGPQLYRLMGPNAALAMEELGLTGNLQPQNVRFNFYRGEDQVSRLEVQEGEFALRDISMNGPPPLRGGQARIVIQHLDWTQDEGVIAQMRIEDGRATVAGIPISGAAAKLQVSPTAMTITELTANSLGGSVHTTTPDPAGVMQPGQIQLGLNPDAPVIAHLSVDSLQLGQLGQGLGIEPTVTGKISGWTRINSSSLSPLDYHGRGSLAIEKGRLSTVPILAQIWSVLGVNPPVFRRGEIDFRLDGDNRIRIEQLVLNHDLLNIEGKGWVHFDGFVDLKVTLRKVMLFLGLPITDLPLISNLFDLFVEQEIYGPFDRLQLSQRSVRKVLGRELPAVPFPLWLPDRPRLPAQRSPALPFHPDR
jgi:hypothetical protein